jgi:HEAT repeat protein
MTTQHAPRLSPLHIMKRANAAVAFVTTLMLAAPTAQAGRGSSLSSVERSVQSGSADAIAAELERAELLYCPACLPLVRPLVDHPDRRVREVAAWWLARKGLRAELAIEAFSRLAQADSQKARNAAEVLGGLRHELAVEPLGAAAQNPTYTPEARAAMARALGRIGAPQALSFLRRIATLGGAADAPVREAALEAMRGLDGFTDGSAALPALADADAGVRAEAAYTIGSLRRRALAGSDATNVAPALARLVASDPSAEVRRRAAWALGEIAAPASVAASALERAAAHDPNPLVRSIASAAAGRLAP